ncbi:MAG: hypothetical protein LZF86_110962 [Nitrospira sp.]|nr:MAG: hypothetical protein LZF86_110962 [Nitrospira sp.]
MEYGLTRLVLDSTAFVPITEDEYISIAKAKDGLFKVLSAEEQFDLVVENYLELEASFLESTVKNMVLENQDYEWGHAQRRLFNRRLANLLSAFRSYVDCAGRVAKEILTDNVDANVLVAGVYSKPSEGNFLSSFIWELRNTVQHHGFPIHSVVYPAGWRGEGDASRMVFGISVRMDINHFKEDKKFNKLILEKLEALGSEVDLKLLVRQYVEALGGGHAQLRRMVRPAVQSWDSTIMKMLELFKSAHPTESPAAVINAVIRNGKTFDNAISIFGDFIKYRKALEAKNGTLVNLGRRFVTGESLAK